MNEPTQPLLVVRYRRLMEIAHDLASTLELEVLLERIVQAAAELCLAEAASILLYDEYQRELYFQAATNMEAPMRGIRVPLEGSVAGWIVRNAQPVIYNDIHEAEEYFAQVAQVTELQTQSLLGVPLMTQDRVIGVLEVINKVFGEFTRQDLDLLQALGAQAAVAIQNSRLFRQSDLIAELVHELRTPLSSLAMAARFLDHPNLSDEQRREMIATIQRETDRLSEMTTTFLDLARLESGRAAFEMTWFDLPPLVEECFALMEPLAAEKRITLENEVPAGYPQVYGDRSKIKQVLVNLLSNAIKYNRPEGRVTVSGAVTAEELLISVSDTGLGISEEEQKHLFEKFFRASNTRHVGGTGLGLAICKRIVDSHGGSIEVQSALNRGSTFVIHLPFKPKP